MWFDEWELLERYTEPSDDSAASSDSIGEGVTRVRTGVACCREERPFDEVARERSGGSREAGSCTVERVVCGGSGSAVRRALEGPLPEELRAVRGVIVRVRAVAPRAERIGRVWRADSLPAAHAVSQDAVFSSCACMDRRDDSDSWRIGSESVAVDPDSTRPAAAAGAAAVVGRPATGPATAARGESVVAAAAGGAAEPGVAVAALMWGSPGSGVIRPLANGPVPGRIIEEDDDDIADACPP